MTKQTFSTHVYADRKPPVGTYLAQKVQSVGAPDPHAEHLALLTLVERGHTDLIPMLGLDTHTCSESCERNAT